MAPHRVLLFGDQTVEKLPSIQDLVRVSRNSPLLRRFLQDAADVVQTEVAKLNLDTRRAFVNFDSFVTLAEENAKQDADEVVATTLMCIARLGQLLIYVENDPSILDCSNSVVHMLGLCTGLLPAAVAAVAKNTEELMKFGLEIVAIAVRLADGFTTRSKRIEGAPGSWAYTIVGVAADEAQAVIDGFHQNQDVPEHRHVFVGVSSRTWTTVFGPPSVLAKLWSYSPELGLAPKLKLAANAAVHAAHLPMLDMEQVIGQSVLLKTPVPAKARIVSSSTGLPYEASDLGALLHQMILDITQNTLRLTDTVQSIVSELKGKGGVDLIVVGPTAHTKLVQGALQDANIKVNLILHAEALAPERDLRGGCDLVAIVGMSGRFPGSENVEEFWDTLQNGQVFHKKIPKSRFDIEAHFDPTGTQKNSLTTQYGCFLEHPGLFDSRLFNVSPREALQMDPLQRLLLMTSYEAMEKAGYTRNGSLSTDPKRVATYMAQATDDWRYITESQGVDIYHIPGVARAFTPGRLNYHFKWEGASHSIDAACAGGTTAVNLACSALIARECDTAVAGAASIMAAPGFYSGLSRGGFLSPTGGCKTFQNDADGYCRGEGVGVVVLKRLEDAIADNDNIQAVINTSARTYSADTASITQPHAGTQSKLYKRVLRQASVNPVDIGYIEMHGTGTQQGDLTEIQSVKDVFGSGRTKDNPLVVGAVKANVGHGEAAAGITSLIKCVKILQNGLIPPQPGMPFQLNSKFPPLDKMHIKIASGKTPFNARPTGDGKKKVLLNNFDASGGNTCLILEDPPHRPHKGQDPRMHHVVVCSARTSYSLKENQLRLLQYLSSHPESKVSDIAYTTTARRMHDVFRSSYVARTSQDLARLLTRDLQEATKAGTKPIHGRSQVVFAFTGQGSLYPGMGKQLFETCSRFRESILSYQKICDSQGLPLVLDLIADGNTNTEAKTAVQLQLAIVFLEIALADLWKSWGVLPDLLIGHSLGEYTALCISGVLSVSDTLYLVGRRASMMEEKCTAGSHAMLAVGASVGTIEEAMNTQSLVSCEVSCRNAPDMSVVSGTLEELNNLQGVLQAIQVKTKFLQVPYAFHSSQMDPLLEDLEASARGIHFAKPLIPIASTLIGDIVDDVGVFTPEYLARQARERVNFVGALQACKFRGAVDEQTLWIEIGPEPVCLGMIRSSVGVPSARLIPTIKSGEDNWKTISSAAATAYKSNIPITWTEYHREYVNCLTLLELPTYAFDVKDYWSSYTQDSIAPGAHQVTSTPVATPEKKSLTTTCLQYVEKETFEGDKVEVTFSSLTSEPKLFDAIQGHLVDNIAICPASVFGDMAFTAAKYVFMEAKGGKQVPEMSLWALEITKPLLVPHRNPQQMIEVTAVTSSKNGDTVHISFKSKEGTSCHEHGSCDVRFGKNDEWKATFSRTLHLVKKRMDDLTKSATAGLCHRLQRPIVYRLFASLVEYSDNYQGLEEVFLEDGSSDAAARIKLRPTPEAGNFTQSPYWTDAIIHLAGFVLNGNVTNSSDIAYISTGIDALHIFEELSVTKTYTNYVSIQATDKKDLLSGDVYVFEGDRLVALCSGIYFQKMTKNVLHVIFGQAHLKTTPAKKGQSANAAAKDRSQTQTNLGSGDLLDSEDSSSSATGPSTKATSSQSSPSVGEEPDRADILLNIVASESGYDITDMEPSTLFSDMGVDSLMSIAIISAAQREMDMELPASFFNDNPAVSDVRREFGTAPKSVHTPDLVVVDSMLEMDETTSLSSSSSISLSGNDTPDTLQGAEDVTPNSTSPPSLKSYPPSREDTTDLRVEDAKTLPASRPVISQGPSQENGVEYSSHVVLIRGRASSKETPLFLITDGAGSATAYIHLPAFSTGNSIYALESPFLHAPQEYTCSVEEVCRMYCASIRKTQPHGPYILGGWSAGAVYAYEVARQLLEQNEKILGLILIDMRVPKPMPDALEPTVDLIESAGLFTGINRRGQSQAPASQKLKQHLVSTVKALIYYQPTPMDASRRPNHCSVIWAAKGLSEFERKDPIGLDAGSSSEPQSVDETSLGNPMDDAETGLKSWFYSRRSAFGPNGWDKLLGDVECHVVEGADHFSMVVPPKVKILGQFLEQSMKKSLASKS